MYTLKITKTVNSKSMDDNPFLYTPKTPRASSIIINIIQFFVIVFFIIIVMYLFIIVPAQVDGPSMQRTLMDRDLLFANKIIQILGNTSLGKSLDYDYKRGDIVVFDSASYQQPLVKRIIAGPKDTIQISNSQIYVNGKQLDEDYIPKLPEYRTTLPPQEQATIQEGQIRTLDKDEYFLMGDNRQESVDSRDIRVGIIKRENIRGKVFLRVLPFEHFGFLPSGTFKEV